MIGDENHRAGIKQLYGFESWPQGRELLPEMAHLPVLETTRAPLPLINRSPLSAGGYIDMYGEGDTLVSVRVNDCGLPVKAREALIDHLMTCTAPRLPEARDKGIEVGDVAFAGHDDGVTSISFVRDRWLVQIHSCGGRPYPVGEFSKSIDDLLVNAGSDE